MGRRVRTPQGIHLFEDVALFENVDAEGNPVPAGEPGARCLPRTFTISCSLS